MKSIFKFFKTTLVGGALILVPLMILVVLLGKALDLAHKVADPVAEQIPVGTIIGFEMPVLMAILVVLLFCFVAGIIARGIRVQKLINIMEDLVLSNIPGYEIIKSTSESILGAESETAHPVVLVQFDDGWQMGLRIDELETGLVTVFVPDAPSPRSGSVFFLTPDRVIVTNIQLADAIKCLKSLGGGSKEVLSDVLKEALPTRPTTHEI